MTTPPVVLTIAGTDSGGGAGLAADLATVAALGAHGTCVVTAITAQDTTGVHAIHSVPVGVVTAQLEAVLRDLPPAAVKTGMLGTVEVVVGVSEVLGPRLHPRPLVVDPVLRATSGAALADEGVVAAYREHLLPLATVATPNAAEARALLGLVAEDPTPPDRLAQALAALGPAVVVTGGPEAPAGSTTVSTTAAGDCVDWLAVDGTTIPIRHPAVITTNDHGTGCTYASAFAAHLAHGADPATAAARAAAYVTAQLRSSSSWDLGRGRGPVAHTVPPHPTSLTTPHTEEIHA
jgi:hydroxymethylpyrimidine/phosphomethylpyrimidine kinase